MRAFLLCLCVFSSAIVFGQPAIQWAKSIGGTLNEASYALAATSDGGYIVAGESGSINGDVTVNHGQLDGWVVKLTATGSVQWQKSFGGSGMDVFKSVSQTKDGGYIVAGYSDSKGGTVNSNGGILDYWVVKLTGTGVLQWQKTYGGSANDDATSISETPDGGYIVGGSTLSFDGDAAGNHGMRDALIIKLANNGNIQWKEVMGGGSFDNVNAVKPLVSGGYICAGSSNSLTNGWLIRLDNNGTIVWQKEYSNGGGRDYLNSISIAADGGFIAAGVSGLVKHPGAAYDEDAWIIKTDSSGNLQWQKKYGGSGSDYATAAYSTNDGNYVFSGYTSSTDGDVVGSYGSYESWIVKLTPLGDIVWQKTLGGNSGYQASSYSLQAADKGYVLTGYTSSDGGDVSGFHGPEGIYDMWVVKLATDSARFINITASPSDSICAGTPVTFTALSSGGIYQWQKNHTNVGTNSPTYKDSALQNGDTVLCILTTNDTIITSNVIGITVATPAISIIGPSIQCAGKTATYKATATLAGHPISYQWVKNNINVGINSNLYTDSLIQDKDSIWCTIVSDVGCTAGAGFTSNKIVVKALAYGAVTATVTYNPHNYKLCFPGDTTSVTFHAVGEYGGANPSFQWVLNNRVVGTDTSFYTATGVKAGDKIYCRYTSSQKCVTGDVHTVISNKVTLTTKATLTPSITIMQTPDTAVCAGIKVRFKVGGITGGGENPIYQWIKNNVPVGDNTDTYYDSTLANNDSVWCKMISHHPCLAGPSAVLSNKKKVKIDNALPPTPSVISGPSTVTVNQANIYYSVSPQSNVTYLWSIPADASFVTDKHNSSVTVNWGSTAGNIIAQTRNGCGYSAKRVLAVNIVSSLVNADENSQAITATGKASIYPNPAKNFATVSFMATQAGKYMVQITDANGRILQVKEANAVKGRNTISINVSGYAKGSYFVRLSNKDGKQQATFTLVVAK